MKKYFGTDGVRGVANIELTAELAFKLGRAGAHVLAQHSTGKPKVLVGKDGRLSGDMLEAALTAGLCSIGVDVYQCGIVPTPAVAHLIRKYGCSAGVMISASHNPMQDNGIKFFSHTGLKLPDHQEEEIEALLDSQDFPQPSGAGVGAVTQCNAALGDYAAFLISCVPDLRLVGTKIALDCANGATSAVAATIFSRLGATVSTIHNTPNGCNINLDCGSTHLSSLQEYVITNNLHMGIAFDGDGDRMLAVDENGKIIDGDVIMAICALDMHQRGKLANATLVSTVMSNQGLDVFCNERGITVERTSVGDRYVLAKMLESGLNLGGEQSGHLIFSEFNPTGDGILAAVQLLAAVSRQGKSLTELAAEVTVYPQVLVNVSVPNARVQEFKTNPKILDAIKAANELLPLGRLLVRASGTEPLVRVMVEGPDTTVIEEVAQGLSALIKQELSL